MELAHGLELETVWLDTTCLKTNTYFPVDWVLLGDAVRTLMKATRLIRTHGLQQRMAAPETFLQAMNRLSIQMTHARRARDSQEQRKKILRLMKQQVKVVAGHARRHRALLDQAWAQTDWTRPQAEQVLRRLDGVLALLPQAQKQAHERIIGERRVDNADKVLSLYETDTRVIVRPSAENPMRINRPATNAAPAKPAQEMPAFGGAEPKLLEQANDAVTNAKLQPFLAIRITLPTGDAVENQPKG